MQLVYRNEERLFRGMLVWSLLVWGVLLFITFGLALVYLLFGFLFYCVAQSALISYIKGNGVRITEEQFPDLKQQISACCRKLGLDDEPQAYLMQMGGMLNAFATRFLGRHFLVLYSDVVDGLADNPDALNFYIGHEIGHIKRKHLNWATILMPASVLPLIGPAYSRAREYTWDRHGLAACDNPANAEHGLAVLAAGGKRARTMNHRAYVEQARQTEGFCSPRAGGGARAAPAFAQQAGRIAGPVRAAHRRRQRGRCGGVHLHGRDDGGRGHSGLQGVPAKEGGGRTAEHDQRPAAKRARRRGGERRQPCWSRIHSLRPLTQFLAGRL